MIETLTAKGRIVSALLGLAAQRKWADISMLDIADAASMTLIDLRKEYQRKSEILSSFGYMVDDEVLRKAPRRTAAQPARDAIFEVVMSRFDALQPYKAAMKSAADGGALDGSLLKSLLRSQSAMLQAASVNTEGLMGALRVAGLAGVFARTFHTWLDDTDPGMARTMAFLDRQLRSGERSLAMADNACGQVRRFANLLRPGSRTQAPAAAPANPPTTL